MLPVPGLNKSIEAVQSVYQKEKQESSMCDSCPMRWFSSLCSEVEGNYILFLLTFLAP